jgi:elongation factor G
MARSRGPLAGFEVVGTKMILEDGSYHPVDSSDLAFQICARTAYRQAVKDARPVLLEPVMKVEIEVPAEFQGAVSGDLASRRGMITDTDVKPNATVILAEVPLAKMFGYATDLRSLTQGQATFSMEFGSYRRMPGNIQDEVVEQLRKESANKDEKVSSKKK